MCEAFGRLSIPALGIDWGMSRHAPRAPWLSINLAEDKGLNQVMEILNGCVKLYLVWFGMPCNTATRAREIVRGPSMPPQLRSPRHPEGMPGLPDKEAKTVEAANKIYSNCREVIEWCQRRDISWCVENPANSYLWNLPAYFKLLENPEVKDIVHSDCMVGGRRDKKRRLRTNRPGAVAALNGLLCDKKHTHPPWLSSRHMWHNAEEAEYPAEFCTLVAKGFGSRAVVLEPASERRTCAEGALAAAKRPKRKTAPNNKAVGIQPRASAATRSIPEYRATEKYQATLEEIARVRAAIKHQKGWTGEPMQLQAGIIPEKGAYPGRRWGR